MRVIRDLQKVRLLIRQVKKQGKRIGFVPTMGALHEGHLSLLRRAKRENDWVIVSIFVNPIQFDRGSDYQSYPRPLSRDLKLASQEGADLVFIPPARQMVPPDFQTSVTIKELSQPWEGHFRPGHFEGVATVVTKLFHLIEPDMAYFGQKDAQQARIVQQLIRDLNLDVILRILPTVREKDGLAMSSRNQLLSSRARRSSRILFQALQEASRLIECGERRGSVVSRRIRALIQSEPHVKIDYVALVDPKTFQKVERIRGVVLVLLAVWIDSVRLIDNKLIRCSARS